MSNEIGILSESHLERHCKQEQKKRIEQLGLKTENENMKRFMQDLVLNNKTVFEYFSEWELLQPSMVCRVCGVDSGPTLGTNPLAGHFCDKCQSTIINQV